MSNSETLTLPRWVYILLATVTAAIGLAASGVTAKFFVLGLEKLESDPMAKNILIATGVLMILTELAAFGVAALLPSQQLRAMRTTLIACGVLLLAFEATTIYVTQAAIDQSSEAESTAVAMRIRELQTSIEGRRTAAQSLRLNGELQGSSSNSWTRTLGAGALRDALKVEEQIAPLANELSRLQMASKPTMGSVLGQTGTQVYGIARGLLISTMGLVMFSAAGALMREGLKEKSRNGSDQQKITPLRTVKTQVTNRYSFKELWGKVDIAWKGWCAKNEKTPTLHERAPQKELRRA